MLQRVARRPEEAGLFLDFDGTLSEIVASPAEARPAEGGVGLLSSLGGRYRVVAVISGRPAADVAAALGSPQGVRILGLYGLEDPSGRLSSPPGPEPADVVEDVERVAGLVPGASVERKPPNVAVHYRGAADVEAARRVLLERLGRIAERHRFRLLEGRKVVELAAGTAPTKGDAVLDLARRERLRSVLYAGDDVADLEAFDAVDRLAAEGVAGVKVAVRSEESPPGLLERADLVVEGPRELLGLLRELDEAAGG